MREDWLTIKEINKKLGKPRADSTIHRWSNDFDEFLHAEEVGGKKIKYFPPEDIETFKYIIRLQEEGRGTEYVKQKLREEFPITINIDNENDSSNLPFQHQQNEFIELRQILARYEESNEIRWNQFLNYHEKLHEKMESLQENNKKLQEDNEMMKKILKEQQQENAVRFQELKESQEKSIEEISKKRKEFYDSLEIISSVEVEAAVAKVWQREKERDRQENNNKKLPWYKRLMGK